MDTYRNLMGDIQEWSPMVNSHEGNGQEYPPSTYATNEIMGSFYEAGWEISSKWLKVNICYTSGAV
jgi:hypothetical protein